MKQTLKDWTLVIAIIAGIAGYFVYTAIPWLDSTHAFAMSAVGIVQPVLIFAMLFLSFIKVSVSELRVRRWHLWLLLIQALCFVIPACLVAAEPSDAVAVVLEGAMICLICPTATAAAVVTRKLGGSMASVTAYTILINLLATVLIPLAVPFVHPDSLAMSDGSAPRAMGLILGKVFPLLMLPLVIAVVVRKLMPGIKRSLDRVPDLAFYIWAVSLALAIAVTVRSIVHTPVSQTTMVWLVAVSLVSCLLQFAVGRRIGRAYGDAVTAGQALGQKNTVFAIWLAYTFFSPVTAIAPGFYCIWHNVVNSWQLYRHNHNKLQPK